MLCISTLYNGTVGFPAKFNAHYYFLCYYALLWFVAREGKSEGKIEESKSSKIQKFQNPKDQKSKS